MPISEALLGGIAVGIASQGFIPVIEFQFMGFVYAGFEQIISHAARMHQRTQGRLTCPIVYRIPYGGGIGAPEHHSESTEALFAHIPNLHIMVPANAHEGYHLLNQAIDHPGPVIFLEPKKLIKYAEESSLDLLRLDGVKFDLFRNQWKISNDKSVNYIAKFKKN